MKTLAWTCFASVNLGASACFTYAALVLGEIDRAGPSWPHLLLAGALVAVASIGLLSNVRSPGQLGLVGVLLLTILPVMLATAISFWVA